MALTEPSSPGLRDEPLLREPLGPLVVLYDGDCSFCRWAVAHARRWDRGRGGRGLLGFLPLAEAPGSGHAHIRAAAERFDLAASLTVVDPQTGATARGGDAILAIVVRLPDAGVIRPWLEVEPFRATVRALYRLVAANRDALVGLGLGAER